MNAYWPDGLKPKRATLCPLDRSLGLVSILWSGHIVHKREVFKRMKRNRKIDDSRMIEIKDFWRKSSFVRSSFSEIPFPFLLKKEASERVVSLAVSWGSVLRPAKTRNNITLTLLIKRKEMKANEEKKNKLLIKKKRNQRFLSSFSFIILFFSSAFISSFSLKKTIRESLIDDRIIKKRNANSIFLRKCLMSLQTFLFSLLRPSIDKLSLLSFSKREMKTKEKEEASASIITFSFFCFHFFSFWQRKDHRWLHNHFLFNNF